MVSDIVFGIGSILSASRAPAAAGGGGGNLFIEFGVVFVGAFIILIVVSKLGGDIDLSKGIILSGLLAGASLGITQVVMLQDVMAAIAMAVIATVLSIFAGNFTAKTGAIAGVCMGALEYAIASRMLF